MAILKSIFAENYASFANRIEFTCESASNKKEHKKNTTLAGDTELNLVSFIYGSNGSGKSYFCRIFQQIQETILSSMSSPNSKIIATNNKYKASIQPKSFAFDTEYKSKPTTLGIEIIINDTLYIYEFSIFQNEIISEYLKKKKRRTETILKRTSPKFEDIELKSELKSFDAIKQTVRKDALCLAIAANLNNSFAIELINSIWKLQIFNMATTLLDPPKMELLDSDKICNYTNVLKHADPTIKKMEIQYLEEKYHKKPSPDDFENRDILDSLIKIDVKTEHTLLENGIDNGKTTRDISFFEEESLGTVKLFTTLPYLFDVLKNGDVLVLDEIENGLHINIVKEIIMMFLDEKKNPNHAQLICTSHQPLLLDGTDTKLDQVWVLSKDKTGKSSLKRLSNCPNTRNNSNLSNKIIEGALGCNPDLFF